MFHVKLGWENPALFHVKQSVNRLSEASLLSDTELPEDDVENVFDINPAEQPAQRIGCGPELLRGEFFALANHCDGAPQRICGLPDQHPLPLARDRACLARTEIALGESNQRRDQLRQSGAAPGGNPELGQWPTSAIGRAGGRSHQVDLVADEPDRRISLMPDFAAIGMI